MRQLSAAVLVAGLLACAASAEGAELEIVAPDKVATTPGTETSLWVRNTGGTDADATVHVLADDVKEDPIATVTIPGERVARFDVTVDEAASGELVVRADGFAPASVELAVAEKPVLDRGVDGVLRDALIVSAIVMLIHVVVLLRRRRLSGSLPDAGYDFDKSFASNLTAAGGLLTAVVAAGVLPDETVSLPKEAYTALGLVFALAIAVSALLFKVTSAALGRSTVIAFLISAFITLFATVGQLWTLLYLIDDLTAAQGFSESAVVATAVLVGVSLLLLLLSTLRIESAVVTDGQTAAATPAADGPRVSLL